MQAFELNIFDDQLLNGKELKEFLDNTTGPITLSTRKEGPSLKQCGVIDILDKHCARTNRAKNTITIETLNSVEKHGYPTCSGKEVWWSECAVAFNRTSVDKIDLPKKRFACMIGRKNPTRLAMLYCLREKNCLLSSMRDDNFHPELLDMVSVRDWVGDFEKFVGWSRDMDIGPLDHYTVMDQYRAKDPSDPEWGKTHMSLLNFYHNFDIEIVVETWTMGETFSPTEKTVRPTLAGKPFIIYGSKDFMKNYRSLGFRSYSECWDESYDQHEGLERWKRMQVLIEDLSGRNDYMKQALAIAEHNKKHALEMVKK